MTPLRVILSMALCWYALEIQAQSMTPCRQALALGLDVSASVDAREYRLQLDGLAAALGSPEVRDALLAMPSAPVQVLIYEWSGLEDQELLVDWTEVASAADIAIIQTTLGQIRRRDASPGTALGPAMQQGAVYLTQRPDCWRHTLDISGDGTANSGIRPAVVKTALENLDMMTINALVIGGDTAGHGDLRQAEISALSSYFRENVILGPDAFVQTALGYEDYAAAMARKLKRELEGLVVSTFIEER